MEEDLQAANARLRAELANVRRSNAKTVEQTKNSNMIELLKQFVNLWDMVELMNINMIDEQTRQLRNMILQTQNLVGVEKIGSPGERFDPSVHEAIESFPAKDVDEPEILDIVLPGYRTSYGLLRAAKVVVVTPVE